MELGEAFLKRCSITIKGDSNRVCLANNGLSRLSKCRIKILGNNNDIFIGNSVLLNDCELYIEDDNGKIQIGDNTTIMGDTELAVIEGCEIRIGKDCMFSSNITFRTGDSHSVLDEHINRINPSKNIYVGNHVWVGNKTILLKETHIDDNCIIATGSIVCGITTKRGEIVGGNPAKVIKTNINWDRRRIPMNKPIV